MFSDVLERLLRKVRLGAGEGVVTNVEGKTIDTVGLSELNVALPVINRKAGRETDDVVRYHDLGDTRIAGHLRGGGISESCGSKEPSRGQDRAEVHDGGGVGVDVSRKDCVVGLFVSGM